MICPACGQSTKEVRHGVVLPLRKLRIYDAIKAAGEIGLTSEQVTQAAYDGENRCSPNTIKAHIFQINEMLASTDFCIVAQRGDGWNSYWVLTKMDRGDPAPARFQNSASWRKVKSKKLKLMKKEEGRREKEKEKWDKK